MHSSVSDKTLSVTRYQAHENIPILPHCAEIRGNILRASVRCGFVFISSRLLYAAFDKTRFYVAFLPLIVYKLLLTIERVCDIIILIVKKNGAEMIILGIDPGLAIVGYGVIEYNAPRFKTLAYGAITTPAGTKTVSRLENIYSELGALIDMYKPDDIAIEELFFNNNQKTAITVAEARGVILLAAYKKNVNIFEYTPLQVKQAVVGYGRAEKKQVIMMTQTLLNLQKAPKLDDTADALAIAVCHAHTGGSKLRDFYNIK